MKIWEAIDINRGKNVEEEIKEYETLIEKLKREEIHPERFKSYRLNFGTYGVRGHSEGTHMQRIKVPGGFITSDQLKKVAELTRKYAGSGVAHLTTRQDIQLHYIKLENIPSLLRGLAEVGMTTREACGNTVRNITASPITGICPDEEFDVLPYTLYLTRYFLRHPLSSTLPRKFKIAFSECQKDHALSRIHDIGAVAKTKKENGKEIKGFKVYVGGGLGAAPMEAKLLVDFVSVEDFYPLAESILRVFHKHGKEERKFRNKARMKFLIARIGFEEFRKLVLSEFERMKKLRSVEDDLRRYVENFPKPAPTKNGREDGEQNLSRLHQPIHELKKEDENMFRKFLGKYTIRQKQKGFIAVFIKPHVGNLTPEELIKIAEMSEKYGAGYVKITQDQNILLPWVEEKFTVDIFYELKSSFLNGGYTEAQREIVSCPGAYSCRLAVTHSYNLVHYIGEKVPELHGLRIHISGCPNSCGQHHVADLGFYGSAVDVRVNGQKKKAPSYIVLIGGYPFYEKAEFGKPLGKIPAKNIPEFVGEIVEIWKAENKKKRYGSLKELVEEKGIDFFRRILAKYSKVSPSDPDVFREPGEKEDFKMEAEARGECAGSLIDVMAINLFDSLRNIYEAEDDTKEGKWEAVAEKSLESIVKCAKMYVYLTGEEPEEEEKILSLFSEKILPKGWLCNDFSDIKERYFEWKNKLKGKGEDGKEKEEGRGEKSTEREVVELEELAKEIYDYAKLFVSDCDKAFVRLQPNLKIEACLKSKGGDE